MIRISNDPYEDNPYDQDDPYEDKNEEMANAHLGRVIDSRPSGEDAAGHQDHSLKMGLPAKFQKHYSFVVVLIIVVCSTPHYQQTLHIHNNLYEYIVCFETYFCNFRDSTSVASDILLSWRKS